MNSRRQSQGHSIRSLRVLLVAVVLALAWTVLCAGEVNASTDYMDLLGDDTYHTSVLVSKAGFAPGVDAVVVANGDDYMSATCSAVLAAVYGGPVLLTSGGRLDPRVCEELLRLEPKRIFVVGTEMVVASGVEERFPVLATSGRVVTLCGEDGRETACLIAEQVKAKTGANGGVVLVSEDRAVAPPACAVSASALAAGRAWPLLFVPSSGPLPDRVAKVFADLAPAVVIGVQTAVDVSFQGMFVKLSGSNVYEVGAKIARYASSVGLDYGHIVAIDGSDESSGQGLSVGSYLARNRGIAVVCGANEMPAETIALLLGTAGEVRRLDFCGPQVEICERIKAVTRTDGALPTGFGMLTVKRGAQGALVTWLEQRLADLSYRPGRIDGKFDARTRQALIAFQKWEGLKRDGVVGPEVWWRLLAGSRPVPKMALAGVWAEVDKSRQLLLYCVDGQVERTLAVSTGNPRIGIVTPSGVFHVTRENTRERYRYKPLYLRASGYLAIHGYESVPAYEASHGCVRTTRVDMDELHAMVPVGTAVYIY